MYLRYTIDIHNVPMIVKSSLETTFKESRFINSQWFESVICLLLEKFLQDVFDFNRGLNNFQNSDDRIVSVVGNEDFTDLSHSFKSPALFETTISNSSIWK